MFSGQEELPIREGTARAGAHLRRDGLHVLHRRLERGLRARGAHLGHPDLPAEHWPADQPDNQPNSCKFGSDVLQMLVYEVFAKGGGTGACKKSLRAGARSDFLFIFGTQEHLIFCVCDGGEGGCLTLTPQTIIEQ